MRATIFTLAMLFAFFAAKTQTCFNAQQIGGTGDDGGFSIAVDASGNYYITGPFTGTVDFDPGSGVDNHTSNGNWDIYLCKFDAGENLVWARTWGSNGMDRGSGVTVDQWGNVYVTGPFQGTADFDPGPASDIHTSNAGTMNNPYICKFDKDGNFKWAKTWGPANSGGEAYSCTVDKFGNVYAVGDFSETTGIAVDFDPGNNVDNKFCNGAFDAWIVKYDSLGNYLWGKTWGGSSYDDGPSVAVDDGGVYDAGMYMSLNCDFDPGTGADIHSSNGDIDVFVNKFDFNGNHIWTKTWGDSGADDAGKIITDNVGHFYVSGYFTGTADFDPGTGIDSITSAGGIADIFISKFDTAGNFIWAKSMGGPGEDKSFALAWDGASSLYSAGYFTLSADFDPSAATYNLTSFSSYDAFVCKMDTSGNFIWAKQLGGAGDDKAVSCAYDNLGNIYSFGGFSGTADFDPDAGTYNLTSFGGGDIFVDKIFDCPTDVKNNSDVSESITVSPNPAVDIITVCFSGSETSSHAEVNIYNMQGQLILRTEAENDNHIDIQNIPAGIYIVKVFSENKMLAARFVKE